MSGSRNRPAHRADQRAEDLDCASRLFETQCDQPTAERDPRIACGVDQHLERRVAVGVAARRQDVRLSPDEVVELRAVLGVECEGVKLGRVRIAWSQSPSTTRATSSNEEAKSSVGMAPCCRDSDAASSAADRPALKSSRYMCATLRLASSRGSSVPAGVLAEHRDRAFQRLGARVDWPSPVRAIPSIQVAQNSATQPESRTSRNASSAKVSAAAQSLR